MTRIEMEGGGRRVRIAGEETAAELTDLAERLWPLTDVPAEPRPPAGDGNGPQGVFGFHTENVAAGEPLGYGPDDTPSRPLPDPHA